MISASTAHQLPRKVQPGTWQAHRLPRAGFWLYSRGLTLGNPPQNRPSLLQLRPRPSLPRGSVCSVGASWATLETQRAGCVGFGGGAEGPGPSLRPLGRPREARKPICSRRTHVPRTPAPPVSGARVARNHRTARRGSPGRGRLWPCAVGRQRAWPPPGATGPRS